MSITDELREWVTDHYSGWKSKQAEGIAIADRIDAEHEKAMYEMRREHDEWVADRDAKWVTLPFDKDGKVWRVGDELLDDGMVCEVVGIGQNRLYYYCDATDTIEWTQADSRRHYHAPTVEDVLREFAYGLGVPVADSYVAATAAKLRLAEGEDA